jgi:hypothetical protein
MKKSTRKSRTEAWTAEIEGEKKTRKPRKAKSTPDVTSVSPEETALIEKYPHRQFVPGSFKLAGEHADFPKKRSIEIRCEKCGKARRVATSDVFQVAYCTSECRKAAKKDAKTVAATDE